MAAPLAGGGSVGRVASYDAFLLVSVGGPEQPADVMPFLRNVTAGRGIPDERLERVAEHYYRLGGVSPINEQCRDLIAAVKAAFSAQKVPLPVYWGNRNWHPYLRDTLATMAADGVQRALAVVTSGYSSYSSCRQYLEDIEAARSHVGSSAPQVDKIRPYFNHPGYVGSFAAAVQAAAATLPDDAGREFDLIFTAHSIPAGMAAAAGPSGGAYQAQLAETARLVAQQAGFGQRWWLAYSSRSGPPSQPWLEPDVNDLLAERAAAGTRAVVVVPIGFISDHMEVRFDLDIEAAGTARKLGLAYARAATPGTDPMLVSMIVDLVTEQLDDTPPAALGALGPWPGSCPAGCCARGRR